MTEALSNVADSYFAALMLSEMGPGSSYATLKLASVEKWAQFDPEDFKGMTLPFGIVMSNAGTSEPAGHDGDAAIKTKDSHAYALIVVCDGTRTEATANAKTLAWRVKKMLRSVRFQGDTVTTDDGTKLSRTIQTTSGALFREETFLWAKPTSKADSVYGLGVVAFTVSGVTK